MNLHRADANDRAFARAEAAWLREPEPTDEELAEAEAAFRLAEVEDAGAVISEPSPGEWRVARDLVLLGGGESMEAAVEAAFAVMFPAGRP